ncbi:hypothetical protein NQ315_008750 [Exocentrus adspersus]|uniref:Uncharacterized protein n=1 Tax=Exocentrus adspersus TaxID=1586481 RepID=A0AAV8VH12_9CUCU|nr:hypothetical protein NQ315_008750 [Exocentrus adspersus]
MQIRSIVDFYTTTNNEMASIPSTIVVFSEDKVNFPLKWALVVMKQLFQFNLVDEDGDQRIEGGPTKRKLLAPPPPSSPAFTVSYNLDEEEQEIEEVLEDSGEGTSSTGGSSSSSIGSKKQKF